MPAFKRDMSDASSAVHISPKELGKDGRVKVWSLVHERWEHHLPIQAKELIHYGECSFHPPGEEPPIQVLRPEAQPSTVKTRKPARGEGPSAYSFGSCTHAELREFARDAKIRGFKNLKREELITVLTESGYVPVITGTEG